MARKNIEAVQFHVPQGSLDTIRRHAKNKGYDNLSAYIRNLIEVDVDNDLNLDVEHGGSRVKLEDGQPEQKD